MALREGNCMVGEKIVNLRNNFMEIKNVEKIKYFKREY